MEKFLTTEKKKGLYGSEFVAEVGGSSRVFGRNNSITVYFEGNQAYTDGDSIVYPAIPQDAFLSEEEVKIARGYVDHEAAHIRFTDMRFYKKMAKDSSQLLSKLLNCVEDIRIERLVTKEYKGAKKNLSSTAEATSEYFLNAYEKDPTIADDKVSVAGLGLTWLGRIDMQYDSPTLQKVFDTLPKDLQVLEHKWVRQLDSCKSTQDAFELAKKIQKDLGIDEEAQKQKDQQKETEEVQQGEQEGEQEKTESQEFTPEELEEIYDESFSGLINREFQNLETPSSDAYRAYTTKYDRVHTIHDKKEKGTTRYNAGHKIMFAEKNLKEYHRILRESSGSISVMRRKLERAIQSRQRVDWDGGRLEGRLDSKRLVSAYQMNPDVYKKKEEAPALDTAITVLIDQSGSMGGRRIRVAQQISIALYECFSKIGVPFEVLGFNTTAGFPSREEKDKFNRKLWETYRANDYSYARTSPLHTYVYSSFTDNKQVSREALSTMIKCVDGCNCDGESVKIAYERLKKRPESRKIMLVLSDGQPNGSDNRIQKQYLRDVVNNIEKDKVDIIGVGIQSDAVQQFYPTWVVCYDIDDLHKNVMDKISRALLGQKFCIDNKDLIKESKNNV